MLTVKIHDMEGTLIFAGAVPEENVKFEGGINSPRTAAITLPIKDLLAVLADVTLPTRTREYLDAYAIENLEDDMYGSGRDAV